MKAKLESKKQELRRLWQIVMIKRGAEKERLLSLYYSEAEVYREMKRTYGVIG